MADRYAGRHIRAARHGAWITKKRARQTRQLLPAAAAMTVAGLLVGGAGTVINSGTPTALGPVADNTGDPGATPATRANSLDRVSRNDTRASTDTASDPDNAGAPPIETTGTGTGSTHTIDMGTCDASYYDEAQLTADGETFNPNAMTAAHQTLPFNTRVKVTNIANGKSVVVRINDRGPYVDDRCLDLSRAAFASIANPNSGVVDVRYEVLVQDAT